MIKIRAYQKKGNEKWRAQEKLTISKTRLCRKRTHTMTSHTSIYRKLMNREKIKHHTRGRY